jgi:hypothetical protein
MAPAATDSRRGAISAPVSPGCRPGQALAILGVLQQRFGAPSRKDWACTDLLQTHFPGLPKQTVQFWQQIGSGRAAAATDNQSGVSATTHMEKYCEPPP